MSCLTHDSDLSWAIESWQYSEGIETRKPFCPQGHPIMQTSTTLPVPALCERMPILRRVDCQTTATEAVKFLQRRLNDYGFHLILDGFFGPTTEAAVRSFQERTGIQVDTIVGPQTWHALGACIVISGC